MLASVAIACALYNTVSASVDPRLKWWTDARFGMFIHWDMSSLAGTEISWSRKGSKPLDIFGDPAGYVEDPVYDHLYEHFNPNKFQAEEWATLASAAGMKYVVFTAKHHGGFSMFHSALSEYGIKNTAFGRDVVRELFDACRRHHLKVGVYYSQRDWHQPDYGSADASKYHAYLMGQLTELLTHYGKVDVMWFDSFGKGDSLKYWKADEMVALVHRLQPGIIVNNRAAYFGEDVPSLRGDFDTPEQRLGEFQNDRPWESCMTLVTVADGGGWSYRKDGKPRTYAECVRALASCATGDGNLLLDVGPDASGVIPSDQSERLREMGAWINIYGKSIYGTRGGPFKNGPHGGSTYRDRTVYLHVFNFPAAGLVLPALKSKVREVRLVHGGAIQFSQNEKGISIDVPAAKRDSINTVLEVHLDGLASKEMEDGKPIPAF